MVPIYGPSVSGMVLLIDLLLNNELVDDFFLFCNATPAAGNLCLEPMKDPQY